MCVGPGPEAPALVEALKNKDLSVLAEDRKPWPRFWIGIHSSLQRIRDAEALAKVRNKDLQGLAKVWDRDL